MIAAVVFDMDGVIVDTEQVWDEVREQLVADWGGRYSTESQRAMMGMSSGEWSRYMHVELGLAQTPAEINDEVVRRMLQRYRAELPLIDGAVEAVRDLSRSFPLAVASSSNRPLIDAVLDTAGIQECFAATVSRRRWRVASRAPTSTSKPPAVSTSRRLVRRGRGLRERHPRGRHGRDARDRVSEPALPPGGGGARPRRRRVGKRWTGSRPRSSPGAERPQGTSCSFRATNASW